MPIRQGGILASLLRRGELARRDEVVLATKVCAPVRLGPQRSRSVSKGNPVGNRQELAVAQRYQTIDHRNYEAGHYNARQSKTNIVFKLIDGRAPAWQISRIAGRIELARDFAIAR